MIDADARRARFERDGFLAPVAVLDAAVAARHRARLEAAEASFGPLHYGVDRFGHFGVDVPASADLDPAAVARQRELDRMVRETMGADAGRPLAAVDP